MRTVKTATMVFIVLCTERTKMGLGLMMSSSRSWIPGRDRGKEGVDVACGFVSVG